MRADQYMRDDERLTPAMRDVLDAAPQIMVGVRTRSGTHTTPELFTISGGNLWCLTAATTLKAKVLRDGGDVAVAASAGDRSVLILGTATVIDAAHPVAAAKNDDVAAAPVATAKFLVQNAADMAGAVLDAFTGKLGALPPRRVLLAVQVSAAALLVNRVITDATGTTAPADSITHASPGGNDEALDLVDELPENLSDLTSSGQAFVGWTTTTGAPVVFPGEWRAETTEVDVAAAAFDWAGGVADGAVAIVRDTWSGYGPSGKQGLMVRGDGVAAPAGDHVTINVDVNGVTFWDGVETGTVAATSKGR